MLKVLSGKTNWAQTVDSALRGQKSFASVYFRGPYMEVLDRELGLSVCFSQTYPTVCISQLTWGLMLQCFSAPELPLTKYRLKSVFVSSCLCVCVFAFSATAIYVCLGCHVSQCSWHRRTSIFKSKMRSAKKCCSNPIQLELDWWCHRYQWWTSLMTDRRMQANL